MGRRRWILIGAAAASVVGLSLAVIRYVPEGEVGIVRTGGALRQVPSGFLLVNPLSESLDRLPTRNFDLRGVASFRARDGFAMRLPFAGTASVLPREFAGSVGDRGGYPATDSVARGISEALAVWGAGFDAADFLARDLSETARGELTPAGAALGIQLRDLRLEPPDPDLYVLLAEDAVARRDPATRLPIVEEGMRRHPGDWRLLTARGLLYEAADDPARAEALYLQALQGQPGAEAPLGRITLMLQGRGELFRLEKILLDGLAANPSSVKIREWLALAYIPLERYAEALDHLEKARQAAPSDPAVLTNLGALYQKLDRFEDAESAYQAALEQAPGDVRARFNLGLIELQRGELDAARESLERARDGGLDTAQLHNMLAKAYQMSGRREEATRELLASYRIDPKQPGLEALLTRMLGHPPDAAP